MLCITCRTCCLLQLQKGGFQQITGKAKQKAGEVADDADKGTSQSPFAGLFGGAKKAKQEAQDTVEDVSSKPKSSARGLFGGAKKAKQGVEDTVAEESSKPKSPLGGLFGGAKKARQEAVEVLDDEGNESINPIAGLFGGVKNPKVDLLGNYNHCVLLYSSLMPYWMLF